MFEISDVMVDKEEVAMTLNIRLELPAEGCVDQEEPTMEHEVIVSDELSSVSKTHIEIILQKMAQILMAQGISCFGCSLSHYKLYPLSGDCHVDIPVPLRCTAAHAVPACSGYLTFLRLSGCPLRPDR